MQPMNYKGTTDKTTKAVLKSQLTRQKSTQICTDIPKLPFPLLSLLVLPQKSHRISSYSKFKLLYLGTSDPVGGAPRL